MKQKNENQKEKRGKFVDEKDEPENLQYRWTWMMNWLKKNHPKVYDEISKAYMDYLDDGGKK